VDRYRNQFANHSLGPGPEVRQLFGRVTLSAPQPPSPYQEPDDDMVFEDVLIAHESPLGSAPLGEIQELLIKMAERFVSQRASMAQSNISVSVNTLMNVEGVRRTQ